MKDSITSTSPVADLFKNMKTVEVVIMMRGVAWANYTPWGGTCHSYQTFYAALSLKAKQKSNDIQAVQ